MILIPYMNANVSVFRVSEYLRVNVSIHAAVVLIGFFQATLSQTINGYVIPATGSIIYGNSAFTNAQGTIYNSTNEYGNEISFAPKAINEFRTIGEIDIPYYYGDAPPIITNLFCGAKHNTIDGSALYNVTDKQCLRNRYSLNRDDSKTMRFRMYSLLQSDTNVAGLPGEVIYDSGNILINRGYHTVIMGGLNLENVPDKVIWTVEYSGITSNEIAGSLLYSPPTVGHSYNDCWVNTNNAWTLTCRRYGDAPPVFAANFKSYSKAETNTITTEAGLFGLTNIYVAAFPDYNDVLDGYDTNRINNEVTCNVGVNSPNYGIIDINPYPNSFYATHTLIKLTAIPAPGCNFIKWSGNVTNNDTVLTLLAISNIDVRAVFEVTTGTVSSIAFQSNKSIITWNGNYRLQESTLVNGPWLDVFNAILPVISPYTNNINKSSQYFRLRSGFEY